MTQISQKKSALHKIRYKRFGGVKMSFCNTLKPDRTPGPISGNPLHNLCERACIQVRKVFDACINQTSLEDYGVTITNPTPANYTTPLTFVSAASTSSAGTISNLIVTPLSGDNPHNSRVQATITIPVEVIYVDANNVEGKGTADRRQRRRHNVLPRQLGYPRRDCGNRERGVPARRVDGRTRIFNHQLRDGRLESRGRSRASRAVVRILLYPALSGIYAGSLHGRV